MGRKKGSKNIEKQPEPVALSDDEKLSLVANLLLELIVDELTPKVREES
jgi:hypothetical protein